MNVEKSEVDGTVILSLEGHIGEAESQELEKALSETFKAGSHRVVIDLSKVDFMTSSGLGVLLTMVAHAKDNDGFLRLANPQPLILQILRTTRLDNYFEVFGCVDEALKA